MIEHLPVFPKLKKKKKGVGGGQAEAVKCAGNQIIMTVI